MAELEKDLDKLILYNEGQRDMCHDRKQFEMALSFSQHVETLKLFKAVFDAMSNMRS